MDKCFFFSTIVNLLYIVILLSINISIYLLNKQITIRFHLGFRALICKSQSFTIGQLSWKHDAALIYETKHDFVKKKV